MVFTPKDENAGYFHSSYVLQKISAQTRNFTLEDLEAIYRQLLDVDEQIKTGQSDPDAALEVLPPASTARTLNM